MPTLEDLSDNFKNCYRAYLAWEQQLFLNRGHADHPECVRTKAKLDELWELLTTEERRLVRDWPVEQKNYPPKLMQPSQPELREKLRQVMAGELNAEQVLRDYTGQSITEYSQGAVSSASPLPQPGVLSPSAPDTAAPSQD